MYDLVFIGGGLSSSLTLVYLLKQLGPHPVREGRNSSFPGLHLAVLDRDGEFGAGFPYGHLAHPMFLLNETVRTMDICGLWDWLVAHRDHWLNMLQHNPSTPVKAWLQMNQPALSNATRDPAQYLELYLPRCVFGLFMRELLCASIERAREDSKAKVDLITGEAISLTRVSDASVRIGLRNGCVVRSRRAFLGLGSLPPRPALDLKTAPGYVHDLYRQGPESLRALCAPSLSPRTKPRKAVIIGSNSAAMEAIYAIRWDHELSSELDEVLVISPSGSLPDGKPSRRRRAFETKRIRQLARDATESTADDLLAALLYDVERAKRAGYTSLDYSSAAIESFPLAFARLSLDQQRCFVEHCGARFTALNRHTPPEYADAAESLMKSGKLHLLRGRVTAIEQHAADLFVIVDTEDEEQVSVQSAVVINCRGSERLNMTCDPLLCNILEQRNVARINAMGNGIAVTPSFEASPGIFVMGPLLACHSSDVNHIWNLESAPRIHALTERLAAVILKQILREIPVRQSAIGDLDCAFL
jgi:uncharacterized NAD(P)/FAD-binding protein YdhS